MLIWGSAFVVLADFGGLDTLHIISGVTSTETLLSGAGLVKTSSTTGIDGIKTSYTLASGAEQASEDAKISLPTKQGLEALMKDTAYCVDVNVNGVVVTLATFVSTSSSWKEPSPQLCATLQATNIIVFTLLLLPCSYLFL